MSNEVYRRTHDGLARLLSPRAATRVLDSALRRSGQSAESLSTDTVRDLLMGPVRHELAAMLPQRGLRRTLRQLAREVRHGTPAAPVRSAAARAARTLTPTTDEGRLQRVTESSVFLPGGRAEAEVEAVAPTPRAPAPGAPVAANPAPAAREGGAQRAQGRPEAAPPRASAARAEPTTSVTSTIVPVLPGPARPDATARTLTLAELERAALGFASLEAVRAVCALRGRGEVALTRGEGLDPAALGLLLRGAIPLLRRHGRFRSFVLEHTAGVLVIVPIGHDTIAVLCRTEVNLGAVFAARAALEEGL